MELFGAVVAFLIIPLSTAVKVDILSPVKKSTTEAALIFTPGENIKGDAYRPLANVLQNASGVRLWIVLLENFINDTPNSPEVKIGVDMAAAELKRQGMKSDNIFLAGHSLGGMVVGLYGQTNPDKLKGILLMASCLKKDNPTHKYPLPLLTISGDLDGLTRITRIVDIFEELQNDVNTNRTALYRTPVIVMPGVNHGQFASGTMPPKIKDNDIEPELSLDEAHQLITGHVNNFLVANLITSGSNASNAKQAMEHAFNHTAHKLKPFSKIKAWFINPVHSSTWSAAVQNVIINELASYVQVNNTEVSEAELMTKEPFTSNITGPVVQTYTTVVMPTDTEDIVLKPQSPVELQVKMKSFEGVHQLLPNVTAVGSNMTCKQFNLLNDYTLVLTIPKYMQTRHIFRGGQLKLNDDIIIDDINEWYKRQLDLQYLDDGSIAVTSYAFKTPIDYHDKNLAGMYFCKLLSPYRVLEWIAVDSLKHL